MIFPLDINKKISDKRKATAGDNAVQMFTLILFIVNLVGYFVISWLVNFILGAYSLVATILALVILNLFVGVTVFRFYVFDETEKIREFKQYGNDSFARYMRVRKDVNHQIVVNDKKINAVEFDDGSAMFVLELKFGSNNDVKANHTKQVLNRLLNVAGSFKMESRAVVLPEDITKSVEYSEHIRRVNQIQDVKIKNCMTEITEAITNASKQQCNTCCIYIMVRATNAMQRGDLDAIAKNYCAILSNKNTAFRHIKFLNVDELLSFYCDFYGVDAIDVSMMRALEMSHDTNNEYKRMLSVYSLTSNDGKTYTSTDKNNKIFNLGEKTIG